MKIKKYSFLLLWLFLAAFTVSGSDLITVSELAKKLRDKNTVIVSCRKPADYDKVHIPGAVNIHHMELYKDPVTDGYILPPDQLAQIFGEYGITETKTIVLYDEGSGKYSGRLYWILKYLGAPNVKILDGQLPAWKAARKALTGAPTSIRPAVFTPHVQPALLATTPQVKKAIGSPGTAIIDARSPEEYNGTDARGLRPGHIPEAINIDYREVEHPGGKLKSPEELKKLFTSKGVTPDKEAIVYCKTSVRAGIIFFALKSILGYPNVRVYDEAYLGWQQVPDNPVASR